MIRFCDLTRMGQVAAVVIVLSVAVIAIGVVARAWDDLWDGLPWSAEQRLERTEARLEQVQADLDARRTELAALERQAEQVADAHRILNQARAVTVRAQTRAEEAPDAHDPIDPDRADRLRDADRRLCELSPDLCPAAADSPAASGP